VCEAENSKRGKTQKLRRNKKTETRSKDDFTAKNGKRTDVIKGAYNEAGEV
jgi:hypothetical protein